MTSKIISGAYKVEWIKYGIEYYCFRLDSGVRQNRYMDKIILGLRHAPGDILFVWQDFTLQAATNELKYILPAVPIDLKSLNSVINLWNDMADRKPKDFKRIEIPKN